MPIQTRCPGCNNVSAVATNMPGKWVVCPSCRQPFAVVPLDVAEPGRVPEVLPAEELDEDRAPRSRRSRAAPLIPPPKPGQVWKVEDPRKMPTRIKHELIVLTIGLVFGGLALAAVVVTILFFVGFKSLFH